MTVRYGKSGTTGQTQEKVFDDAMSAGKHVSKLIAEKTGKGYAERGVAASISAERVQPHAALVEQVAQPVSKPKANAAAVAKPVKPKSPAQDPEASAESLMVCFGKDDATNRLLAKHPRASGQLLEKLSHSSDKATRQGVARNPNTAPETLVRLGQQFPKEFLANPALDLLLMVNPALMEEVPESLLVRLLKQTDCPASLLTWAAGHLQAKVQLAVAMNAKAPDEALAKLQASRHASVQEVVRASQSNPNLAQDPEKAFEQAVIDRFNALTIPELTDAWLNFDIGLAQWSCLPMAFRLNQANGGTPDWGAVMSQLVNTTWTPDVILKLIGHENAGLSFAQHPSTPVAVRRFVLEELAKDPVEWKRRTVAENPITPLPVLEALARDNGSSVRKSVAANSSTPVHVVEALAKDKDDWVLTGVARNPHISMEVMRSLAKNKDHFVRSRLAENPATPVALLEILAKDKSSDVRMSVAKNRSTPASTLEILASDTEGDVLRSVAENPSTPVDVRQSILQTLSKHHSVKLRCYLAEQLSTPASVLEALANDKDSDVRRSIAKNLSTPPAILEAFA